MKRTIDLEKNKKNYLRFVESRNTLILSMVDDAGNPFSSCAPFIKKGGKLYIFISEVAEHYQLITKNKFVDVLLIADESETKNAFATERARWRCLPKNIGNDNKEDIFELFHNIHGKAMVEMLRGLDFSLFELIPVTGRYVVGFGMAFDVDIDGNKFSHVVIDKNANK